MDSDLCLPGTCGYCDNIRAEKQRVQEAKVREAALAEQDARRQKAELERAQQLQTLRAEAVYFTNQLRGFMNLAPLRDLLPGDIGRSGSCPITNSVLMGMDAEVSTDYETVRVRRQDGSTIMVVPVPRNVVQFLKEFDERAYPDLKAVPKMEQV